MKRLHFTISIKASKSKVWDVLWDDATYQEWTSAFSEGSRALSDWKEGSQIWFLDSNKNGMYSVISKIIPEKQMLFTHQGVVIDGVRQVDLPESAEWRGAKEEYNLSEEEEDYTLLAIDMDVAENYLDYFKDTVPKGLDIVKKISESK